MSAQLRCQKIGSINFEPGKLAGRKSYESKKMNSPLTCPHGCLYCVQRVCAFFISSFLTSNASNVGVEVVGNEMVFSFACVSTSVSSCIRI